MRIRFTFRGKKAYLQLVSQMAVQANESKICGQDGAFHRSLEMSLREAVSEKTPYRISNRTAYLENCVTFERYKTFMETVCVLIMPVEEMANQNNTGRYRMLSSKICRYPKSTRRTSKELHLPRIGDYRRSRKERSCCRRCWKTRHTH